MVPLTMPSRSPIAASTIFFVGIAVATCCSTCAKFSKITMAFAPAIPELVFKLTRRVERIHIHNNETGAQDAGDRDRVLRHVRHHDCHPVAPLQSLRLQVGREGTRQVVDFPERERHAHEEAGRAFAEALKAFFQQRKQRGKDSDVDFSRHTGSGSASARFSPCIPPGQTSILGAGAGAGIRGICEHAGLVSADSAAAQERLKTRPAVR